jgi:hypothetical protein
VLARLRRASTAPEVKMRIAGSGVDPPPLLETEVMSWER